jgi:hypothetical protein
VLASWLGFAARRWRLGPPGPAQPVRPVVPLPAPLWLCFALPAAVGMVVAWPHIGEGVRNYPAVVDAVREFHPPTYLVDRFVKPLLYFFSFAFLLANAVRDSHRPERFIAVLAMSAVAPALAVFWTVAQYPGSLAELARDREFMAPRGMHANEFGLLLALLCGPLLFLAGGAGGGPAGAGGGITRAGGAGGGMVDCVWICGGVGAMLIGGGGATGGGGAVSSGGGGGSSGSSGGGGSSMSTVVTRSISFLMALIARPMTITAPIPPTIASAMISATSLVPVNPCCWLA